MRAQQVELETHSACRPRHVVPRWIRRSVCRCRSDCDASPATKAHWSLPRCRVLVISIVLSLGQSSAALQRPCDLQDTGPWQPATVGAICRAARDHLDRWSFAGV